MRLWHHRPALLAWVQSSSLGWRPPEPLLPWLLLVLLSVVLLLYSWSLFYWFTDLGKLFVADV